MTVTRPNGDADQYWRRPGDAEDTKDTAGASPAPTPPPAGETAPGYAGPPQSIRPPPGWRPPVEYEPAPPRELPAQDHAGLDTAEQSARTVTYGIGLVAGAILLVVICALCSRVMF